MIDISIHFGETSLLARGIRYRLMLLAIGSSTKLRENCWEFRGSSSRWWLEDELRRIRTGGYESRTAELMIYKRGDNLRPVIVLMSSLKSNNDIEAKVVKGTTMV